MANEGGALYGLNSNYLFLAVYSWEENFFIFLDKYRTYKTIVACLLFSILYLLFSSVDSYG